MPVIPGESCVGFFGCCFLNFKGLVFFLVQYLLDRQTWKHQQNSCLLHFVSTLLKQMSSVYMFCVNKQHCTYTHKHNLQIIYFSSWEKQLGKVSSISYLLGSESRSNTCQVFWILMSDSKILTNTHCGSVFCLLSYLVKELSSVLMSAAQINNWPSSLPRRHSLV